MDIATMAPENLVIRDSSVVTQPRADGLIARAGRELMRRLRDAAWLALDLGTEFDPVG